jgi:peptidoglycan/LPS O-acetylase OafA/YrhL
VIATHAAEPFFSKTRSLADVMVGIFADFHVPCFFAISGYLYAAERRRDSAAATGRRLLRLLPPYFLAAALAYLFGLGRAGSALDLLAQVAVGATLGIYYFVFVLLTFVLLAWALGATRAWIADLLLVATLVYWALAALVPALRLQGDLFWHLRNPLNHVGYFLIGWVARLRLPTLAAARLQLRPLGLLAASGMLVVYYSASLSAAITAAGSPGPRFVYVLAVLLLAVSFTPGWTPRLVMFLSRSSYPLYLFHTFFQEPTRGVVSGYPAPARIGVLFVVGLLGATLSIVAGRALLGPRLGRVLLE